MELIARFRFAILLVNMELAKDLIVVIALILVTPVVLLDQILVLAMKTNVLGSTQSVTHSLHAQILLEVIIVLLAQLDTLELHT